MDRIQDNQSQSDILSDPNLLLAVAMVKSISSLIDGGQGSSEEADWTNESAVNKKAKELKVIEVIDLVPIQELSQKLKDKKLLNKEEITVLNTCLNNKFLEIKDFVGHESVKIQEFLTILYYVVLNAHSYSYCQNHVEKSLHQKLVKDIFSLIKKVLDILTKNDADLSLYNQTIPIIVKFQSIMSSREAYDQAQFRYLRQTNLRINSSSLSYLNAYLTEAAPSLYGNLKSAKFVYIKREDVIVLPQSQQLSEQDSLDKLLDFVPQDYSTMTTMLNEHLQQKLQANVKDEEMSQNEEEEEKERQSTGAKDLIEVIKEHNHKLKISDLLNKSKTKLLSQLEKSLEAFYLITPQVYLSLIKQTDSALSQAFNQNAYLSITSSLILFFMMQKQKGDLNVGQAITVIANMIRSNKIISGDGKTIKKPTQQNVSVKIEDERQSPTASKTTSVIKTRGQIKKEQGVSSAQKPLSRNVSNSRSQDEQLSQPQIKQAKKQLQIDFNHNLDFNEILKHSLSFLVMSVPQYLSNQSNSVEPVLFKSILALGNNPPALVNRIIYGILAEFTKPSVKYSKETQQMIVDVLLHKLPNILESHTQTVFLIKIMILLNNCSDICLQVAMKMVSLGDQWQMNHNKLKHGITQQSDIYDGKNFNNFIVFVTSIIMLNNKKQVADKLVEKLSEDNNFILNFNLIQMILLKPQYLNMFKTVLSGYITKMLNDKDVDDQFGKQVFDNLIKISQSKDQIYEDSLLQQYERCLNLKTLLSQIRQSTLSHGKNQDQKPQIVALLRDIIRINQQLSNQQQMFIKDIQNLDINHLDDSFNYAQLDKTLAYKNQILSTKAKDLNLSEEDSAYIKQQLSVLQQLVEKTTQMQIDLLLGFLPNKDDNRLSQLLIDFLNLTNPVIRSKIQQQIIFVSTEDNKMIEMIINQQLMHKEIQSIYTSNNASDEETLYAYTLTHPSQASFQRLVSTVILLKQIFNSLFNLMNSIPTSDLQQTMGLELLKVKQQMPILEITEQNGSFDHETNDKILQKVQSNNLSNKDFMRIRQLDQTLSLIQQSLTYIQNNFPQNSQLSPDQQQLKTFVMGLISEATNSGLNSNIIKNQDEIKIIMQYFTQQGDNSQLFVNILRQKGQQGLQLWQNALNFLSMSLQDPEEIKASLESELSEKKGGVQMTINFKSDKRPVRKPFAKRTFQKELIVDNTNENDQQALKPQINGIAHKMLNFIGDIMCLDRDANASEEAKQLAGYIRMQYLSVDNSPANFISTLFSVNQILLAKKIFRSLLLTSDSILKFNLQDTLQALLTSSLTHDLSEDYLVYILDLSQILFDTSKSLIVFLRDHILPLYEQSSSRFLLLDLMCQLAQSQFQAVNETEQGTLMYSVKKIEERRRDQQLLKKEKESIKKQLKEESEKILSQKDENSKNDTEKKSNRDNIDGFQQEKVQKDETQYYNQYMEKPEDTCTFNQTKKDFSQQHWYFCYSCELTGSNGCCAVCAHKCHKGHHVVYSRKSNFFCDCGESGKCQSLNPAAKEAKEQPSNQAGKRRTREEAFLQDKGMIFKDRPMDPMMGSGMFGSSIFGQPLSRPEKISNPFQRFEDDYGEEDQIIFQQIMNQSQEPAGGFSFGRFGGDRNQFGGRGGRPQGDRPGGRGAGQYRIMSDSSQSDDDDEDRDADQPLNSLNRMSKLLQMIQKDARIPDNIQMFGGSKRDIDRDQHFRERPMPAAMREDSSSNMSQITHINPIEDIMTEGQMTPQEVMSQDMFPQFSQQINAIKADSEMEDISLIQELQEMVRRERGQFDSVFKYLMQILDQQITSSSQEAMIETDEIMSSLQSPMKISKNMSLIQQKESVRLVQDLAQSKKQFKESTFPFKLSEQNKTLVTKDQNLLNQIDSNKDGLIAIIENENDICFYASSQFFEDNLGSFDNFTFELKDGISANKIETYSKLTNNPLCVKFNPAQSYYLMVASARNVDILTLNKQGKVQSKLSVDLMLDIINKDLTIINVQWLPMSQTMIAVGTKDFVKIYDLSEDNISPTHNFMIFNGFITDFAFSKTELVDGQNNIVNSTILVTSSSGQVFYQEFIYKLQKTQSQKSSDSVMNYQDNSDLMLTKNLIFDPILQIQELIPSISVYQAQSTDLTFIGYQNGILYCGKIDYVSGTFSGFIIDPASDQANQGSLLKTAWSRYGENLTCFKEIQYIPSHKNGEQSKLYLTAISRKPGTHQSGIPVIIVIQETHAEINMLRHTTSGSNLIPSYGLIYAKTSNRNSQAMRAVVIYNDGSAHSFTVPNLQQLNEEGQHQANKHFNQSSLIQKTDLPKEVNMPINYFEKMKNLYNEVGVKTKIQIQGDIVHYFKGSKNAFENLSKASGNAPVITEAGKKSIKMNLKLDPQSDHILTGLRLKLDLTTVKPVSSTISFRLLNRILKFKAPPKAQFNSPLLHIWFDIPLCEAESLYAALNNGLIDCEFLSDDPKNQPIKIFAIEVFGINKREFGYREKVRKLEQLQQEKNGLNQVKGPSQGNEESIAEEMKKKQGIPIVSWKEKQQFVKRELGGQQAEIIIGLDVITQFLDLQCQVDQNILQNLVEKLKIIFAGNLQDIAIKSKVYVSASIKRCLNKALSLISNSTESYQTIKDNLLVQSLRENVSSQNVLDILELRYFIRGLSKIYRKRQIQMFSIFEQFGEIDIVTLLSQQYLRSFKQNDKDTNSDIQAIISLALSKYFYQINKHHKISNENNVENTIINIYKDGSLQQIFQILQPFIMHQNEHIQKLTISIIIQQLQQHGQTQAKIIKYGEFPIIAKNEQNQRNLIVVDFAPHLISYLLEQIFLLKDQADVCYSLAYKSIKYFETAYLKNYSQSTQYSHQYLQALVQPIVNFIRQMTVIQNDMVDIYSSSKKYEAQYLYANLVLVNLLLQESNKQSQGGLKIKGSNLRIDKSIKDAIINELKSDIQIGDQISNWASTILKSYEKGFREEKCSFRIKYEEGIPAEIVENLNQENSSSAMGVKLLRPIQETVPWKWHPLFINTEGVFELLDRKIPAQLLLNIQFLQSNLNLSLESEQIMIKSIRDLCLRRPAKQFLEGLGEQGIRSILQKSSSQDKFNNIPSEDKNTLIEKHIDKTIKSLVVFQEFSETFEGAYQKYIRRKVPMTFNMEFQVHKMFQKAWEQASGAPSNWSYFIKDQLNSQNNILTFLFDSALLLKEESAVLCIMLCSLAFESDQNSDSALVSSYKLLQQDNSPDLFKLFQNSQSSIQVQEQQQQQISLNLTKLLDILLLAKNKKALRVGSAFLIKGLYDNSIGIQGCQSLVEEMMKRLKKSKEYGVNTQEYIAVMSYITQKEIQKGNLSSSALQTISQSLYSDIHLSNSLLTSHSNLEIYSTLQRMTSAFSSSNTPDEPSFSQMKEQAMLYLNKSPRHPDEYQLGASLKQNSLSKKITNPYMLEAEACSRCFEQKSLPYQQVRLNDIKVEAKFTDSTMVIKLANTYLIKQISMALHDIKGVKAIKTINIFVNNKQGVDLADMKNNWNHWKRVRSIEAEIGQKNIVIDFTLPVNASNLLIELQTVTLAKPLTGKDRHVPQEKKQDQQSISVTGIDTVLSTLPRDIINKIGVSASSNKSPEILVQNSFEKEQMSCPRCGKQVQGKHGVCNACGENALQCTFCRNINYEKPDGYLCNECGFSRFSKFDFSLTVKPSYATEKIESEEQKQIALQQIEKLLQIAQESYQQLMKKRNVICGIVKKINEGNEQFSGSSISDMYSEDCAALYLKVMKSLNSIKILKVEINTFTHGHQQEEIVYDSVKLIRNKSVNEKSETDNQQCFSCIQEHLKSQLSFVQQTAEQMVDKFKSDGYLKLLYSQNLKMHSQSLLQPARKAICQIVQNDSQLLKEVLSWISNDIFSKREHIPAYQLSQNISQESQMIIEILDMQMTLKRQSKENQFDLAAQEFWQVFFESLRQGKDNAAISDQISSKFAQFINGILKFQNSNQEEQDQIQVQMQDMLFKLFDQNSSLQETDLYFSPKMREVLGNQNFLIHCLINTTSQNLRDEAKDIISHLSQKNKEFQPLILKSLLSVLSTVLNSNCSDQYFDLLCVLIGPSVIKEQLSPDGKDDKSQVYISAFEQLFKHVDSELDKLVLQEQKRELLGDDGFLPQLSTGQVLSRLVALLSSQISVSPLLKSLTQQNVSLIVKSFLKIKKLNLTKNKVVSNSEVEIEKMFRELHSEKESEKEKFIMECIQIIESGDCDFQDMRFLFEEICKLIDPVKPEQEYLLNLNRARSQEFYFRGNMAKNPYTSTSLGKTMAEVRIKICKELELAEPELVELLVSGKLVGMDLPISKVYEQVFWPALCKQRDPESYEVPNIDEAPKAQLAPMNVTYRLMGIDGEATEDRIETLQDGSEADMNPANIEKKFQMTQAVNKEFASRTTGESTNGIRVLLSVIENFGSLQKQRYLAEYIFKLITYCLKLKQNRLLFSQTKSAVDLLAKRLFESVGMQSQIEGQKNNTLFDVVLGIIEQIVSEMNNIEEEIAEMSSLEDKMEIDRQGESVEAATHVEIFIQIMSDACNEMINNHQAIDKTSKKIRSVSKILPFLISKDDTTAINVIIEFICEALSEIDKLDSSGYNAKQKFTAQFNLERVIEILESTPIHKNFLKDSLIHHSNGQYLKQILEFFMSTSMKDHDNEAYVQKFKLSNLYILKILNGLLKNHPDSQQFLFDLNALDKLYALTQAKYQDRLFVILAVDIVESLTNKHHTNLPQARDHLQQLKNTQQDEKKRLAQKKREEIMKQMQSKKNANKFVKQVESANMLEETGPRCIVCQEGYSKKTTDVLGMYVFVKKVRVSEMSQNNNGFVNTNGYSTVTHSNYIHFLCHQNAYKADQSIRQPKKEWEGAIIRNDHTKCNNLFPLRGGELKQDSFGSCADKYFNIAIKTIGQCDHDRVKVLMHDLKMLMKRLSYEDTFSRDSQGGGPEHNMHLVPFLTQMMIHYLTQTDNYLDPHSDSYTYIQEKKLNEFLDQGIKQKQDFMHKLEEEKKYEEIEEEEKFQSEDSSPLQEQEEDTEMSQMNSFKIDQIMYQLTQSIVFSQMPKWEQQKHKFLSVILCTIAGMSNDKGNQSTQLKVTWQQSEYASGKKVLTISRQENTEMQDADIMAGTARRRRLSSDNKIDLVQKALFRLRPLLVQMRLVDLIKQRWDVKKLGLYGTNEGIKHDIYLKRLQNEFLIKGNLQDVIADCDEIFKEYKDRMLRIGSVEEFLQDMGMMESITRDHGTVEQYVLSHF